MDGYGALPGAVTHPPRREPTDLSGEQEAVSGERRDSLRADCSSCFGLCCVALPFGASADFPVDKAAGQPCVNLLTDFRCGIHARLREEGFAGCTVFDCFGAGQKVSQETYGGKDWRQAPEISRQMYDVFAVMRQLHELLWYLTEGLSRPEAATVHDDLRRALERIEEVTSSSAEALASVDVAALRQTVKPLLVETGRLVRAEVPGNPQNLRGADLSGARLSGADLRGADLGSSYLLGADLTSADLRAADLIGADLRGADLSGADLTGSVFLTQPQVNAAKGDAATRLPATLTRPGHWRGRPS